MSGPGFAELAEPLRDHSRGHISAPAFDDEPSAIKAAILKNIDAQCVHRLGRTSNESQSAPSPLSLGLGRPGTLEERDMRYPYGWRIPQGGCTVR